MGAPTFIPLVSRTLFCYSPIHSIPSDTTSLILSLGSFSKLLFFQGQLGQHLLERSTGVSNGPFYFLSTLYTLCWFLLRHISSRRACPTLTMKTFSASAWSGPSPEPSTQ